MSDGSGFCDKPDRDWRFDQRHPDRKPTRCGYPMPCPWHTFIVDAKTGILLVPKLATQHQIDKAKQVRDVLKGIDP